MAFLNEAGLERLWTHITNQIGPLKTKVEELENGSGGGALTKHAEQHSFSDTLTWDGDPTGHITVSGPDNIVWAHVSNTFPSSTDVVNKAIHVWHMPDGINEDILNEDYVMILNSDGALMCPLDIYIPNDNCIVDFASIDVDYVATFPKKGIYFAMVDAENGKNYTQKLTIPGYVLGGSDPITPEMIGAAPANHASADTTYGMATEEMYGHARAYASPHFPEGDEEGTHLVAPDGSEFEFGVPSGYFPDMALFSAVYGIMAFNFQDFQNQIDETSDILFETKQDVNELNTALDNQSTQILNMVAPINEMQKDLSRLSTELEEVSNFVKEENETDVSQYLRGQEGTVEVGYKESQYKLQVNNDGVDILQGNTSMTHIGQNAVSAPTFEAARTVKIGNHTIKMSTSGTLMFN
jgi:archaellum component FlaC